MLFWVLKSAVVFLVAGLATLAMRRRSAALRHLVWVAAFMVVAGSPLLQVALRPVSHGVSVEVPPPPVRLLAQPTASPESGPESAAVWAGSSPAIAEARSQSVLDYATLFWGAYVLGLLGLGGRLALGVRRVRLSMRHGREFEAGPSYVGLDVRVCAKEHSLRVPATFGWLSPVILLPAGAENWDLTRLNAVLAHEVAHIRRADWFWQTVALVVASAQWFNPLAWWAVRQLRLESELAADNQVLSLGLEPSAYAQELLAFGRAKPDGFCTVPMARRSGLRRRIAAVLSARQDRSVPSAVVRGRLVVVGTLCALGVGALAVHERLPLPADTSSAPYDDLTVTQIATVDSAGSIQRWDPDGREPYRERQTVLLSKASSREHLFEIQAEGAKFILLPTGGYRVKASTYHAQEKLNVFLIALNSDMKAVRLHIQSAEPMARGYETVGRAAFHLHPEGKRWVGYILSAEPCLYELEGVDGRVVKVSAGVGRTPLDLPVDIREGRREIRRVTDAFLSPVQLRPAPPVTTSANGTWTQSTIAGIPLAIGWIEDASASRPYRVWAPDGGLPKLISVKREASSLGLSRDSSQEFRKLAILRVATISPSQVHDIGLMWKRPNGALSNGSSWTNLAGNGPGKVGELYLSPKPGADRLDLQLGIAIGAGKEVCSEPIGGPLLGSKVSRSSSVAGDLSPGSVVSISVPEAVLNQSLRLEAYDESGHQLQGGIFYRNGRAAEAAFKGTKVSRIRLLVRPYVWGTFRNVAMHPKGGF